MISKEMLKAKMDRAKIANLQNSNKNPYPHTIDMAKNLGNSIIRNIKSVAAGNDLKLPEDEAKRRLSICDNCEFYNKQRSRCTKCGCYMAIKTYLKAERCPVGKW